MLLTSLEQVGVIPSYGKLRHAFCCQSYELSESSVPIFLVGDMGGSWCALRKLKGHVGKELLLWQRLMLISIASLVVRLNLITAV